METPLAPTPTASGQNRIRRLARWMLQPPPWFTLPLCLALLMWRMPDSFHHPQFWAEDGTEFYHDGYVMGWHGLFKSYVGYFHLLPRLTAAITAWFDPRWAPGIFVGVATALTLYVAGLTQSTRLPYGRHVGFALAVVLIPDAGETLLKLVNIQWILAGGMLLLLVMRDPRGRAAQVRDGIALALFGLTGPFSILFAPLFALRAWLRRTRISIILAAVVLTCAVAQIRELRTWHPPPVEHAIPAAGWTRITGMRVSGSLWAGYKVPADYPVGIEIALGLATLAGVGALGLRRGEHRAERLWLAAAFVLVTAAGIYRVRHVALPTMCNPGNGSRYFYVPQLIVLWLLLAATLEPRRWFGGVAALALVVALAMNLPRLREPRALPDLHWETYAAKIRAGEAVDATINPGWTIHLPARSTGTK